MRSAGWAPLFAAALAGCLASPPSHPSSTGGATPAPGDMNPGSPGSPAPSTDDRGAVWFASMCASCHGDRGEGLSGPPLQRWMSTRSALVAVIDATMPLGAAQHCRGDCADKVADYILGVLQTSLPACTRLEPPQRQLRLLTRREYRNTVKDLLQVQAVPCMRDAECDLVTESCTQNVCQRDACAVHTFVFDPGGASYGSVVVAGSFNQWAPAASQGAWPMVWEPGRRIWYGKHALPDGMSQYKYVLDGAMWIADPGNPTRASDGFGGENSVLMSSCSGTPMTPPAPIDADQLTRNFPVESRPQNFTFDDNAAAGLVTDVHVTEYLGAADALSDAVIAAQGQPPPASVPDFIRQFGKRAFRRPLDAQEAAKYLALYTGSSDPRIGLKLVLEAILTSPMFLYRSELGTPDPTGGFRLTGYEVAAALSYGFWGTMPDDALFAAADRGDLDRTEGIEREARRLLADPRAREIVGTFALEWTGGENVLGAIKQTSAFPEFTDAVRQAMFDETKAFAAAVVFDGTHRFDELLTADWTLVNGPLASIYGISGVTGPELRKVSYPDAHRRGILGHGSVLATYAHSDQSSPILRGVFVRQRLLCQKFGVPPPNAGMLPPVDPSATARERFSRHSQDPTCHACHGFIDPIGFGFENFDAVGKYRDLDNGRPIDATGVLDDVEGFGTGTSAPFSTLSELAGLLADSQEAKSCFTEEWLRFFRGTLEAPEDRCTVDALTSSLIAAHDDVRELMIAVTKSPVFVMRRAD